MKTVFDIKQKQDSAEKLAAVIGIDDTFYINDWELNAVNRKALESAIENIKIDFSWSNNPGHRKLDYQNINVVQLLLMNFRADWILNNTDEVWLLIDRYKAKKRVRAISDSKYKKSGFKHDHYPDLSNIKRPSEILITYKEMILDFGQPFYFKEINHVTDIIRTKGSSNRFSTQNTRAYQILNFRIKVKKGNKFYYSNTKATIKMICNKIKKPDGSFSIISYKLL